ncbi:MAG TPA: acetoacetate--CoA ligase [Acidimicrobiales bacterium]|nr:acetoacetate--CoA ligase [Acidimicrobiales bacterium]
MPTAEPLWEPKTVAATRMDAFRHTVASRFEVDVPDSVALHRWSVENPGLFWDAVWDDCGVIGTKGERAYDAGDGSITGAHFFPDARLNFAENLLAGPRDAGENAISFFREDGERRQLSWEQLGADVAATAAALRASGVTVGDRVAAWMPNLPETVVMMLAATAIGAVFSSTSADFGVAGVVDRFGQIEPTVLLASDGYVYGGQRFDCLARLAEIQAALPSVRDTVVVGNLADDPDLSGIPGARSFADYTAGHGDAAPAFVRLPFDHPGFILYSSGTTGVPKCIVHRAGGVLLMHLKEHQLHCDVNPSDRVFYFTTCGWMMWNWLTSALASKAGIVLFDGSPVFPRPAALFDLADRYDVTLFGTSAKFLDGVRKVRVAPRTSHRLVSLRTITSTGSPLGPEGFHYVYDKVKADVHLASISGGTDLCGCFVGGDPTRPVWAGEIQGPMLGMAVDVYDDAGRPLARRTGELVCTQPFPSRPLGFWGDADGSRYHAAYYERFPGVWAHGDFAAWTEHGGIVISGRSDATLNAAGVRIGTAEIYRQVEQLDEIAEAIAVGQRWDADTRIVLFVKMAPGYELTDELRATIRDRLRRNCSPRHVPARIVAVADIPRTRSGKITELAVADVVNGRAVRNIEALANPEALDLFKGVPELAS